MSRSDSPKIVVGLGAFGAKTAARLKPLASDTLVVLTAPADDAADLVCDSLDHAKRLFGLRSGLGAHDRDLLLTVVADLDEAGIADAAPRLARELGAALSARFSHILGRGRASRLTLAPVVVLSGAREGKPSAAASAALSQFAALAQGDPELGAAAARILVLEPQTRRYELAEAELVSTVVSFLFLLLSTDLDQQEPVRSFFKPLPDQQRDGRVFASFGCATLELSAKHYVLARLCRDLVAWLRSVPSDAAQHAHATAERLIPTAAEIESNIRAPQGEHADLIELLRTQKPNVDVPSIGASDRPETIRDVKFGWGWFDALQNTVGALVRRLDELEMDELARVADERGHKLATSISKEALEEIDESEARDAHGFARALRLVERARAVAERERKALERAVNSAELSPFPEPTSVENALMGLREESTRRPRPFRLVAFGVLAAVLAALLLQHVPKWIYVALFQRRVPLGALSPSSGSMPVDGALAPLLESPWSFFLVFGIALGVAYFLLSRHRAQRHAALCADRDHLSASVERFLSDALTPSVLGFYEDRLQLSLRAWALRALKQVERTLDLEHYRLTALSNALESLQRRYEAQLKSAEAPVATDSGDLLFRRRARSEVLSALYAQIRPTSDVFERTVATLGRPEGAGRDEAPLLFDSVALAAALEGEVELTPAVVAKHLGGQVLEFVTEMFETLGVPLEVIEFDDRSAERSYIFCPDWALPIMTDARASGLKAPEPIVSGDPERVHVLVMRTALPLSAISVLGGDA